MPLQKQENRIVSKKRVADHGEVYTGYREVNAMLDLVTSETQRIDSRFLEPACGTGNFLTEKPQPLRGFAFDEIGR
jgi:type I restriction-modification system DNA methylase subunit